MATGTSFQMDALQHVNESAMQWKSCRCGEGDGEFCLARKSGNHDRQQQASTRCPKCQNLVVFKSGPLFISSKGLGWTSWKKRWFILTRASLVFFRSDPNAPSPRGSEVNLTLGGIELNNSGSVVVRADKKLLTVLLPDGHDGRAFTLKAETSEDMNEWKTALESALSQAPSATLVMGGQSSIFQSDVAETVENSLEQWKDRRKVKSTVIGQPILLALQDVDGNPSFLEKALRYIEQQGVKVEGILRQSADVEEVERRIEEYEQGKNEFSSDEDAHVICDCIKHVLRELPSSPVPASCCTALLEAFRGDRGSRISKMRGVILEIFPEPNRCLLQRILQMMQIVASYKSVNRMSVSAVAACMAPLLLRPLLAGDCELMDDFDMGGDGSIQLLQAAAAANHAQAIVINLLEQYEKIFTGEHFQDSYSSELYSESEGSEDDYVEYEDEESTDNEIEHDNAEDDFNHETEDDTEYTFSGRNDDSGGDFGSDLYDNKTDDSHCHDSNHAPSKVSENSEASESLADVVRNDTPLQPNACLETSSSKSTILPQDIASNNGYCLQDETYGCSTSEISDPCESSSKFPTLINPLVRSASETISDNIKQIDKPTSNIKSMAVWGRTAARKNLSMEKIDYITDDETAVQKLEVAKIDLHNKLTEEVKENQHLQASLERRKEALHNHRWALQQDVERLQLQLQRERDLRAFLEIGLINTQPGFPISDVIDGKTRKDLERIAPAETDIMSSKQEVNFQGQPNQPEKQISESPQKPCGESLHGGHQSNSCSSREMDNAEAYKDDNGQTSQSCDGTQSDRKVEPGEDIIKIASRSQERSRSKEYQDSPTFQYKHPPRRQKHNSRSTKTLSPASSSSHDGPTDGGNITTKKISAKGEDMFSASSALTRLTNRLNFLKERRVQFVNELQVEDNTHGQYSKGPPRTNSR